jgi:hypothetical protein
MRVRAHVLLKVQAKRRPVQEFLHIRRVAKAQ